jgi:succinoglycan biosynthesis protein ExoW
VTTIAAIIPFYQREAGILERSLASIAGQQLPEGVSVRVIVVDDQSPISPEADIAKVALPENIELRLLTRPNGGPGAARNTGLESLAKDPVDFVAFLDSDDVWKPDHLADALAGLGDNADFYFCDHERWYNEQSWFEASETINRWFRATEPPFEPMPGLPDYMSFRAGEAFNCFVEDYFAQTSTVVFRYAPMRDLRFDPSLRHAGEDNMFWLDLATRARRVVFSRRSNIVQGQGVNMYQSSVDWAHPEAARRLAYRLLFFLKVESRFALSGRAGKAVKDTGWYLQKTLMRVWLGRATRRQGLGIDPLRPVLAEKPTLLFTLPVALGAALLERRRERRELAPSFR